MFFYFHFILIITYFYIQATKDFYIQKSNQLLLETKCIKEFAFYLISIEISMRNEQNMVGRYLNLSTLNRIINICLIEMIVNHRFIIMDFSRDMFRNLKEIILVNKSV